VDPVSVQVELHDCFGSIPKAGLSRQPKVGDSVEVVISNLSVDEGILELMLVD
jgi:hypothetical protein